MSILSYAATGNRFGFLVPPVTTTPPWEYWSYLAQNNPQFDGLLALRKATPTHFELFILNRDGSNGQFCGNGLRIAARHLFQHDPHFTGELWMAGRRILAERHPLTIWVEGFGQWLGPKSAQLPSGLYHGYQVQLANPHWVLFDSVTPQWLASHGTECERAFWPEALTNTEFVWRDETGSWQVQLFERGAGITASSGSGAMAILRTFLELHLAQVGEWVNLHMPGGLLSVCWDGQRYGLR